MNTRNTRQKDIIYQTLSEMDSHPTILELYEAVKDRDASVGQATVYRNVSKLIEEGMVFKILTSDGCCHYDANSRQHVHFFCNHCHRLFDLYDIDLKFLDKQVKNSKYKVDSFYVLFEGICDKCR